MTTPLTGTLLVAAPALSDGLFARSVCLVVHHDDEGAIGLLLNRPLQPHVPQLWSLLAGQDRAPPASLTVHFGGPIAGPVMALHVQKELAEAHTGNGIFVAAQRDHLQALLIHPELPYRLIVGHAGWTGGQLEAEIASGLWYTLEATAERVFEADDEMWPDLVRKAAGARLAQWTGIRHPTESAPWN